MKRAASKVASTILVIVLLLVVLAFSGCIQSLDLSSGAEAGPHHGITVQIRVPSDYENQRGTLAFRIPNGWNVTSVSYSGAASGTVHYSSNIAQYFKTTWEATAADATHNGHKANYNWWAGYSDPETVAQGTAVTVTILVDTNDVSGSFLLDFVTGVTDVDKPQSAADNSDGALWEIGGAIAGPPPGALLNQAITLQPATIPKVQVSDPAALTTNVPVAKSPTVTFSEAMDPATITTSSVELFKEGSASHVGASITYNDTTRRATLQPAAPLAYGTKYTLRVDKNVRDVAGHTMAAQFSITFTTVSPVVPNWTARIPNAGDVDQQADTYVTVTFDQDMNAASITDTSFVLKKSGSSSAVPATVSYSAATRTAVLDPTEDLEAGATYDATLTAGVTNMTGQSVAGAPVTWSFTVKTAPPSFTDVEPGSPHAEAILGMAAAGIIQGYPQPDGSAQFKPGNPVWRAQFAKMVDGALSLTVTEDLTSPFTDLGADQPDDLYPHEYVAAAYAGNITQGTSPTTFAPWDDVSRAQVVTMVVRALQNLYPEVLQPVPSGYTNTWGTSFSSVHGPNARIAEYNGLLEGLSLTTSSSNPWGPMHRGEVAQVLWNMMGLIH